MDILVHPVPPGSVFSLVARVLDYHEGNLRCRGISPEQDLCIAGAPELAPGLYTFYDLERSEMDYPNCMYGAWTEAHAHHVKTPFQGITVVDFCSGMGGMLIGSQMLGMNTASFCWEVAYGMPDFEGQLCITSSSRGHQWSSYFEAGPPTSWIRISPNNWRISVPRFLTPRWLFGNGGPSQPQPECDPQQYMVLSGWWGVAGVRS